MEIPVCSLHNAWCVCLHNRAYLAWRQQPHAAFVNVMRRHAVPRASEGGGERDGPVRGRGAAARQEGHAAHLPARLRRAHHPARLLLACRLHMHVVLHVAC